MIVGVFLLASPAVLLPEVWQYMNAYMGERLLTHSGYLFAGQLYKNNMSSSPFWGTPIYFYLLFLAIKVPLMTLLAFLDRARVSREDAAPSGPRVSAVHVSVLDRSLLADRRQVACDTRFR